MRAQIVLATHNPRPDLLARQLQSLRAQTMTDWQCLVLDDASQDRAAVVKQIGTDTRFEVLPAQSHLGPYRAFEHLLTLADEDVPVFLCDQDDYWHPAKLDVMLQRDHTAFSAMRVVSDSGVLLGQRFVTPSTHALTPARLLLMNSVSGAALMVSSHVRQAALPFPAADLRGWHDQWLAAVAAHIDRLDHIAEPLVDYTQHHAQVVGAGLRRLTARRVLAYGRRVQSQGLRSELRARTAWMRRAAQRLLEITPRQDPDLGALAEGRLLGQLAVGVREREVPITRALLLCAGNVLL